MAMNGSTKEAVADAKRARALSVLDDLEAELSVGFLEDTFEVRGVLWRMRTLCDHERNWANRYVQSTNLNVIVTSIRAPTLAIGIRAIGRVVDGERVLAPVEEFFQAQWAKTNQGLDANTQAILASDNPHLKQYFFAEQLFGWLTTKGPEFVYALWQQWETLEARRQEAEKAMGKSSPAGGTSPPGTTTP
jgi:hypothetical protein